MGLGVIEGSRATGGRRQQQPMQDAAHARLESERASPVRARACASAVANSFRVEILHTAPPTLRCEDSMFQKTRSNQRKDPGREQTLNGKPCEETGKAHRFHWNAVTLQTWKYRRRPH